MENAAKALLMIGAVLLSILIISIGVSLAGTLRKTTDEYVETSDKNEIQKFNSNFVNLEGRTDITAQEVVSVVSMVIEENLNIKVYLENVELQLAWETNLETQRNQFLVNKINKRFKCVDMENPAIEYDSEGKICIIRFQEI